MSPTLTFKPLPDSEHSFETAQIKLHKQNLVYVIGFRRNPATPHHFGPVGDVGFSAELVDDKLCIVPADSVEARKMKDTYAAIWLAPGYKVMLVPAEGSNVYYQRAVPGNLQWKKVKHGYGVDLADPLMTVLDHAIHIKFDTRPEKHKGDELMRKLHKFLHRERVATSATTSTTATTTIATSPARPLVRHVHTEIEGNETHTDVRHYQIAAHVTVKWGSRIVEGWKRLPSTGVLSLEVVRPLSIVKGKTVAAGKDVGAESADDDRDQGARVDSDDVDSESVQNDSDARPHDESEFEFASGEHHDTNTKASKNAKDANPKTSKSHHRHHSASSIVSRVLNHDRDRD